jgi:hypothetical protein
MPAPKPSNRRHRRRIPTDTDVVVIVGKRKVRGVVRSASEEGVGVELRASDDGIMRGASVKVGIDLEGNRLEFPGRVAWHRKAETGVGIQLKLEIAGSAYRAAYGRWIADLANSL